MLGAGAVLERAAKAGFWATAEAFGSQGINFLVYLVLARLLAPAEFGVFAIAMFFSGVAIAAVNSGFSQALIQRELTDIEDESTLHWVVLMSVASIALIFAGASSWLAAYYDVPELGSLMLAVAIQIVILSLSVVPGAILVRRTDFATLAKIASITAIVSGSIAIGVAAAGGGIWALAIQIIVSATLTTILTTWLSNWRPIFGLKLRRLRSFLPFASWVSLSGILETVYAQGSGLIVGKLYGSRDLGFFDRARTLSQLPATTMTSIIGRVALPLFAQNRHDRDGLREGVRRASAFSMLILLPPTIVFVVLPGLVIEVLIGPVWLPAAPLLGILALSGALLPVHAINLQLLLAEGGAREFFKLEIAKKIVGLAFVAGGLFFGLTGLAWGYVAASIIALVINTIPTRRSIQYGLFAQLTDLAGLFVCAAAMAGTIYLLQPIVALPPLGQLLALIFAGGAAFIVTGLALGLNAFRDAVEICKSLIARSPAEKTGGLQQ